MSPMINHVTSGASADNAAQTSPTSDPLASESTFLTLLVSQLQNQDPLNPVDSTQFVSQLTEYSQLEQLMGIHQDTSSLVSADGSASNTTTPAQTTGTQNTGN
jgi:flagellar basal-body rod modification protein FlgD